MQEFRAIPGNKYSEAIINEMANDAVEISRLSISIGSAGLMLSCGYNPDIKEDFINLCGEKTLEEMMAALYQIASSKAMNELLTMLANKMIDARKRNNESDTE